MGLERHQRRRHHAELQPGIDRREQRPPGSRTTSDRRHHLPVARLPMRQQGPGLLRPVLDRPAMSGQIAAVGQGDDLAQRVEVVGHRTVRHRHQCRVPAHHVVARKQQAGLRQPEAQMVGAVTRRGHDDEPLPVRLKALAVLQHPVRHQSPVARPVHVIALEPSRRPAEPVPAAEPERRPGCGHKGWREPRVVLVRMGEQDRLDRPPGNGRAQGPQVPWVVRPGVDHHQTLCPDEKTVGPGKGIRRRIGRRDPRHAGRHRDRPASFRGKTRIEPERRGRGGHCARYGERLEIGPTLRPFRKVYQWPRL